MIKSEEIINFIREGRSLCGITIGSQRIDVETRFADKLNKYGDKKVGYIELPQGIRFGYWGTLIDELAVIPLDSKMRLADAQRFLDLNSIKWTTLVDTNDLTILTQGFVVLIFDNETEELRMISKTGDTELIYKDRLS